MAFAIVLRAEEDLYSVVSASQVHYAGEIFEEEGKKRRKTGKKTPYPGKIIKTGVWWFFNCFKTSLNITFQFNKL